MRQFWILNREFSKTYVKRANIDGNGPKEVWAPFSRYYFLRTDVCDGKQYGGKQELSGSNVP